MSDASEDTRETILVPLPANIEAPADADVDPDAVRTQAAASAGTGASSAAVPSELGPLDVTRVAFEGNDAQGPTISPDSSSLPHSSPRRHVVIGTLRGGGSTQHSRYTVTRLHAEGGLGRVWVACDTDLNRDVVLKEIRPSHAQEADVLRRFLKEAQITGQLEHPNIVPIYELGRRAQDDQPYYTMRFVRGETLRDIIRRYHARRKAGTVGPLELPSLLTAFIADCNAIGYAHSRGVVHRDIKPANVALGEFGEVVVLDWGLAKLIGEAEAAGPGRVELDAEGDDTSYGQVLGTLAYMAPEQARGDVDMIDARTDIYSLGAVLFEILTDRIPHQGKTTRELLRTITRGEVLRASEIDADVPQALSAICIKAMATAPADRYATALELATDVQRYLADEPVSVHREPWWDRVGRWVRVHRSFCVATAAVLLVAALSASAWTLVEHRRIQRLRTEAHDLLTAGQQALARNDLVEARLQLARTVAVVGQESPLAEIRTDAQSLLNEANRQLSEQQARDNARGKYARFQELRDQALFHGTLLTGIDVAANLRAAQAAATEALALFPTPIGKQVPAADAQYYSPAQVREISAGCFELLLLLAEATVCPQPGRPADPKQTAAALAIIDRAETWARDTQAYHLVRARCLEFAGRPKIAAEERQRAEAVQPTTALDNFLVGDEEYHENKIDSAIKHFDQALRLQPDHFWAHYFLAICYTQRGQPAQAIAHSSAALSRRPDFGWTYLTRGIAYGELKDFAAAEADFDKGRQLGVADYGFYVNRSWIRIQQGKLALAITDLNHAIELRPEQYLAYVNLAVIYQHKEDYAQSLKQIERAIGCDPTIAQPYRVEAQIMFVTRQFPKALEAIDKALAADPVTSPARSGDLILRGKILYQLKQYVEALRCFDQALKSTGDYPQLERLRADVLLKLGRGRDAVAAFNRVLEPRESNPDDFRKRGFERARLGDQAGALTDYSEALELDPKSAITLTRRGWGFLNNSATLALGDFEQAIKLAPDNGDLYNGRGYARVLLGKYQQGVEDAEAALRHDPAAAGLNERLALRSNAACVYAQAAGKASADLEAAGHDELAKKYVSRAVELLSAAAALLPAETRGAYLHNITVDPAFDPIRYQPAFRALLRDGGPKPAAGTGS